MHNRSVQREFVGGLCVLFYDKIYNPDRKLTQNAGKQGVVWSVHVYRRLVEVVDLWRTWHGRANLP